MGKFTYRALQCDQDIQATSVRSLHVKGTRHYFWEAGAESSQVAAVAGDIATENGRARHLLAAASSSTVYNTGQTGASSCSRTIVLRNTASGARW